MVITSIYTPRKTLIESLSLGWSVVVVGDEKSPHGEWSRIKLENFHYLDPEKQKNLFRNYAYLIMQTVRNRLKKQLKYHKIVLTSDH